MSTENRRHERLAFQGTIFIELMAPATGSDEPEVVLCKTIDISQSGLRVSVNRALKVGAILQIGVELSEEEETFYLTGEVIWCRADGEREGNCLVGFELMNARESDIDTWRRVLTEMGSAAPE